ncbi:MAG: ion transporter [Nitrospirota bacterium]|nr:MAG: ion transporter [Nitrospirota bacterium]
MKELRQKLYEIIFEADTPAGKLFDVVLIISILLSVLAVMLDSVSSIRVRHGDLLYAVEWFFTILFTIEYLLRIFCFRRPAVYMKSFFGVIDLLSILPTYLNVLMPGSRYLLVIRVLRILRVFRVLKLARYVKEANHLMQALRASRRKITVFLFVVLTLVIVFGSLMYLIEGEKNGFTSIPRSVYWAVVTLTTVGYGDISPQTGIGQFLAAIIMVLGYGIIAVPTGIVTVEMSRVNQKITTKVCQECSAEGHDFDADYCKACGEKL